MELGSTGLGSDGGLTEGRIHGQPKESWQISAVVEIKGGKAERRKEEQNYSKQVVRGSDTT